MSAPSPDPVRRVRHLEVGGLRIRTAVRGAGRPLLLIMGIGGNLEMWDPLERVLAGSGVQTLAFDAPGTGGSTRWRVPRRMPALARLVEQVIDGLGFDRVDVLGVSFGGALAQQLAHQAPARVRRLVLAATMPGLGGVPGDPRALIALASPRRYRDPAYLQQVAATVYGGRSRREPELVAAGARTRLAHPPSALGYAHQLYAVQGWSSLPWLHRLPHPTLVLAGDDDPVVPVVNARLLAWRIPRSQLVVLPGAGHLFLLEETHGVAALVRDFLDSDAL